jgi:hypothetical protein
MHAALDAAVNTKGSVMKLSARASLLSLLSFASFALVAVASSAADAQPFPVARGGFPIGGYAQPFRGPMMHRMGMRRAPVVIVTQPAPCAPPVVAPPPSDEHGVLVLDTTALVGGQAVLISWGASYFAGQVIAVNRDGSVRVHYSNYDGMWDEDVARYRLRLPR